MKKIIQVGVRAIRAPDGTFNEATPVYRRVKDVKEKTNLTQRQEDSMQEFITELGTRYKESLSKSKKKGAIHNE